MVDDATARALLLSTASTLVREAGVDSMTIAAVLERAELGTRIFYRNFASKDDLVEAVFVDMARVETDRLRRRMRAAGNPIHGVALWIAGRLDLAFDETIRSDLRFISREAQSQSSIAPQLIGGAFREMLAPLLEQLDEGRRAGLLPDTDPMLSAQLIHGALWGCTEYHWGTGLADVPAAQRRVLAFCLEGLGAPEALVGRAIDAVTTAAGVPPQGDHDTSDDGESGWT